LFWGPFFIGTQYIHLLFVHRLHDAEEGNVLTSGHHAQSIFVDLLNNKNNITMSIASVVVMHCLWITHTLKRNMSS